MERVFGFIRNLREQGQAVSLARGLKYAGRRFQELAGADNALARTMRGDFSVVEDTPEFVGKADQKDGAALREYLLESLQKSFGECDRDNRRIMRIIQEEITCKLFPVPPPRPPGTA